MFMLAQMKMEEQKLRRRRDELREKLKEHFSLPVVHRNYRSFELIVDELDELRQKLARLKQR